MALIYEWGFFIRPEARDDLRAWLLTNEQELARCAPEGLEYLGTYAPVWAPEQRCDLYQVWRWRRANEFNFRAAARADRSDFARLAGEFLRFVDEARTDEETFRLHRSFAESESADRTTV